MCTLTYLPSESGFTFTHNRDERMDRPTSKDFRKILVQNTQVYFPKDLEAHGSWIGFSNRGRAVCLLNGGTEAHQRKESYRHSRGLVVLDNFKFENQEAFYHKYDLSEIEPFTLIIKDHDGLWKMVHDHSETKLEQLDSQKAGIWSSTMLYTKEVRDKRQNWFGRWLEQNNSFDPENIREFHSSAGEGDSENDLIMSRWGFLKTLSITQIHQKHSEVELRYQDLSHNTVDHVNFSI